MSSVCFPHPHRLVLMLLAAVLLIGHPLLAETATEAQPSRPPAINGTVVSTSDGQVLIRIRSRDKELNNTERTIVFGERTRIRIDGQTAQASAIQPDMHLSLRTYSVEGETTQATGTVNFTTAEYRRTQAEARRKAQEEKNQQESQSDEN